MDSWEVKIGCQRLVNLFVKLINLLNTTRCGKLLHSEMNTRSLILNNRLNDVKMSLTRGQSAWVKSPSETKRSAFSSGNALSNSTSFYNWLVGFSDGDGTFYFAQTRKNVWSFSFQIAQSSYNLRVLYFIKSELRFGRINVDEKNKMAVFRIRNRSHLVDQIIPIFDKHPLLTSKHFKYECFKEALLISQNSELPLEEKNSLISTIKTKSMSVPETYKSPVWKSLKSPLCIKDKKDLLEIMTKSWIVGFTEAEGSFYLVKKGPNRLVHAFEITQKLDLIVLEAIALYFNLKVTKKKTYLTVVTTNSNAIKAIIDYFFKTMKGMKALEYRIWARSFNKTRQDFESLLKIRNQMRNIRSIRLHKNFNRLK